MEILTSILGKIFCGDKYLEEVNGLLSDLSCGFNFDMYIALFFLILLILGPTIIFVVKIYK